MHYPESRKWDCSVEIVDLHVTRSVSRECWIDTMYGVTLFRKEEHRNDKKIDLETGNAFQFKNSIQWIRCYHTSWWWNDGAFRTTIRLPFEEKNPMQIKTTQTTLYEVTQPQHAFTLLFYAEKLKKWCEGTGSRYAQDMIVKTLPIQQFVSYILRKSREQGRRGEYASHREEGRNGLGRPE